MTAATAKPARRRRWPWVLAVLAVLLAVGGWWIDRQLEPNRLTARVLGMVGDSLGLELTIDGTPEYALRPEPRLVLPNLIARQPGATKPVLTAARAEVSLPWDTILDGSTLVITRVDLRKPVLDLAALSAWQATRPAAPFEVPTFTKGLQVEDGVVLGDGWSITGLALEVPELAPEAPVEAKVAGTFLQDDTTLAFDASLTLARAGLASELTAAVTGRLRTGDLDVPLTLGFDGAFDATTETTFLSIRTLGVESESPLPDFNARGKASLGDGMTLSLTGLLPGWPEGWPALPEPLSGSESPFDFTLEYDGATDFSAPLSLTLVRDQTRLETQVAVPEMLSWLDRPDASPLPPMVGKLETPTLSVGGATLEGVRVTIEDDEPVEPATTADP